MCVGHYAIAQSHYSMGMEGTDRLISCVPYCKLERYRPQKTWYVSRMATRAHRQYPFGDPTTPRKGTLGSAGRVPFYVQPGQIIMYYRQTSIGENCHRRASIGNPDNAIHL